MTASELFRADALATQFAIDMQMTKQQAISTRLLILQNKGATQQQAFDKVLGEGAWTQWLNNFLSSCKQPDHHGGSGPHISFPPSNQCTSFTDLKSFPAG